MHIAHLARAENELLASLLEDKLRFVFREHVRGAVVLLRQLFLSLHHFAGEANDHVVLIGLSVDRDGTECGASDLHGLILVPKCQCSSRKISYSHFDSRSMRDSVRGAQARAATEWETTRADNSPIAERIAQTQLISIVVCFLGSPHTGGAHASHNRTAGIDSRAWRCRCRMAACGARAAASDAGGRV